MNIYYTYAYLREDGTPYYIGKGKGDRIYADHRHVPVPTKDRMLYLKKNLTEEEAYRHEEYLISVFGRKIDGGILINLMTGGGAPTHSQETIELIKLKRSEQIFTSEVIEKRNKSISKGRRGVIVSYEKKKACRSRYEYTFVHKDGREETTDLLPEFARKHNLHERLIYRVVDGSRKSTGGWSLK